jgi:hypothetical protein
LDRKQQIDNCGCSQPKLPIIPHSGEILLKALWPEINYGRKKNILQAEALQVEQ